MKNKKNIITINGQTLTQEQATFIRELAVGAFEFGTQTEHYLTETLNIPKEKHKTLASSIYELINE